MPHCIQAWSAAKFLKLRAKYLKFIVENNDDHGTLDTVTFCLRAFATFIVLFFLNITAVGGFKAIAQSEPNPKTTEEPKPEKVLFSKRLLDSVTSPVTTDAKYVLGGGSAFTLWLALFKNQIVNPTQQEVVKKKPLGKYSVFGDRAGQMYPNIAYAVGMAGYGLFAWDMHPVQNAISMFEASLYASLIVRGLKATVHEQRPNKSNVRNSFPSGHTTTAFTFAGYIGCQHSWPWGLAAYGLASFVAISRVNDNAHYAHDVAAGVTLGTTFGMGVCLAQKKNDAIDEKAKASTTVPTKVSWQVIPTGKSFFSAVNVTF